tara:strand:- start:3443 stop:3868 length:426 start_codon:yes stop_codon:yes gene_type:complete
MAFTYTSDPENSKRDAVRLLTGDTVSTDALLQDSEVEYFLSLYNDAVYPAAAAACDAISSKYARQADTTNGRLSVKASQRSEAYAKKAKDLRRDTLLGAEVFAGGLTISGKDDLNADTDAVQPAFSVGMDDYDSPVTDEDC